MTTHALIFSATDFFEPNQDTLQYTLDCAGVLTTLFSLENNP